MEIQDLQGKVAIVTGGSTEIAGAVAIALAKAGVRVCLCGRQSDLLKLVGENIKADGGNCVTITSNIDCLEAAEGIFEFTISAFGSLDILILVSPFWAGGLIHNHNVKTWDLVLDANLREPFLMARVVLPKFRDQKHGEIMAIGSDSSQGIYQQDGAYGVAMHALTTLMELIRVENSDFNIRTHILAPGVALTTGLDSTGLPALTSSHIAEWAKWLLTRPAYLRGNGPILI